MMLLLWPKINIAGIPITGAVSNEDSGSSVVGPIVGVLVTLLFLIVVIVLVILFLL